MLSTQQRRHDLSRKPVERSSLKTGTGTGAALTDGAANRRALRLQEQALEIPRGGRLPPLLDPFPLLPSRLDRKRPSTGQKQTSPP